MAYAFYCHGTDHCERSTTGATGRVIGIAGALAGLAAFFGYLSDRDYRDAAE